MNESVAASVIKRAMSEGYGAEITTWPTREQGEALDALVAATDIAPDSVTNSLDMDPGRMWMEVVAAIRADVPEDWR